MSVDFDYLKIGNKPVPIMDFTLQEKHVCLATSLFMEFHVHSFSIEIVFKDMLASTLAALLLTL